MADPNRLLLVTCAFITSSLVSVLPINAQTLYGISGSGQLLEIDRTSGSATVVGNTGLLRPGGLTCNPSSGILYALDSSREEILMVSPTDASTTSLPSAVSLFGLESLAYREPDDFLYTVSMGPIPVPELYRIDPATGAAIASVGTVGSGRIDGLAVRPSDGVLFGAGTDSGEDWLFMIATAPTGLPSLRTPVGRTHRVITGLAFHPDGTLYGSDSEHLVTIDPDDGTVTEVGDFGAAVIGRVTGLAVAEARSPGPVDVWIKDCAADSGVVSSTPVCPQWYKSTDIWIDNDGDMVVDAPVVGADNILKAVVRNRDSGTARDVNVRFYYRNNTTGLVFPDGATLIGVDTITVPGYGAVLATVTWPSLPAPPSGGGHWCVGVVLDHSADPAVTPPVIPPEDNNVGIANLWFIAGRTGETVTLDFSTGSGGKSGFGLERWPREFRLRVRDRLPAEWKWELVGEGIRPNKPFQLRLGEERSVTLKISVPATAKPHDGGEIEVRQVDVATGRVFGGVAFTLYEDHHPPEAVTRLSISVVDGYPVLSWNPILKEADTGLRERVAYYEILRDGKPVGKSVTDADPFRPAMQWIDLDGFKGKAKYSVQVVDEAGNVSKVSPEVGVRKP